jgi:hypothetical protein
MAAGKPSVQASYMKNLLAALREMGRLEALAQADPGLLDAVDEAARVSWLPVALNLRTVEGMAAAFGEERGLALLAEGVYRQFETPLWKHFVRGGLRLLGTDPGSLGRWIPQAMALVFRDCGRFTVDLVDEAELSVEVHALPPELATHRLWLRSLAVGMTPLFTVCSCDGTGELVEMEPARRHARYRLRWKPPR